jgi:catechol 2,3-dioxygenase-like lactoylglutathione lyase family enzyme
MTPALKIVVRTSDLPAARGFYEGVLGLDVIDEWSEDHGDGCIYGVGAGMVELNELKDPASEAARFDLQIKVDDLDPWVDRLEGRWEFVGPKHHPWGERTIRLRDPDGIVITIFDTES